MAIAKNPTKKAPEREAGVFRKALGLTWLQFTSTTSLHGNLPTPPAYRFIPAYSLHLNLGIKHVNDPRGNRFTRIFWVLAPVVSCMCAIALMATFLLRYKSNPTRINVETNFGPISEIEFPAVTFCNPTFITDTQVDALIKAL